MTQNSAQNPEDQAACQSGGQQTSAEGAHAQSGQQAAKAVSQPSAPAPEPSGAAQAAASAAADAPQAEGAAPKASRPVTISAKGFRGMFGNSGKEGKPAASAKPAESAPQSAAPGFADKIFDAASIVGPLALLLIMLAQAWPALMGHSLYCPREAAGILAFTQTAQSGMWLAPAGDGLSQWPVFFWFLRGIEALLTKAAPQFAHLLFPLAAMAGTLLCLVAVWVLGRVAGLDRRAALAGGMLLLCAPIFAPLSTFTGPEALAAAVTLLSLACLCHGWQQPGTTISLPLGFALAALAGLTGGLFYLLLPVLASLAFLLWRCGFRRAQKADGLVGFVLMLGIIGCWLAVVMLWHQPDGYLKNLGTQLVTWPITKATWWKPLAFAALGLLPWLAVICGVSWARVLRTAPADLAASRKEKAGMAFLWIALVFACLLSIFAADMVGAAVCTASLAALLLGKALLRLPPAGAKLFYIIAALCLLHASMALVAAGFGYTLDWLGKFFHFTLTESQRTAVLGLKALPVLGGIGIVAAVLLARLVRRGAHGGTSGSLVMCAVIAVILAQPASLMLMPQLEKTPEAQVKSLSAILTPAPAAPAVLAPEATPAPAPEAPAAAPADTPKLEPAAPAEKPAPVQEPAAPAATQPAEASAPQTAAPAAPTTPAETPAAAPAPTPADAAKELAKEVVKEAAPAAPSEQAPAAQPEQPKEAPKAPAN
ncbi:hypothetical protein SDC9_32883 [bioreactor metagenome]|uniref:Glycosyltransferase RgtA/B/C/D-like domain-containing protein n=1 Tax=bioreactor metagenome TaxID=1076179 RepID=A0A644V6C8_9ZZZZ|nr:hypothetical protein [Desulfovibrio desulfuricans]MEA4991552.1 hypothetical protein [Desulfovibrio desulfuricans]